MNHDEMLFEEFLSARMREKGVSLKRLSETTGIAPKHIENMLRGNFEDMPSTPYFRGYVMRIAKVLDFDGEESWEKLKREDFIKNSGPSDALPKNRFIKKELSKKTWAIGVVVAIVVVYLIFALPRITGKPTLTIVSPPGNPYTTTLSTITIAGTVRNADSLYLVGLGGDEEEITIAPDGSWQKGVLLQNGLNTFKLSAKKLLGGQTDVMEQILYEPPAGAGASSPNHGSSSVSFPTIHSVPEVPATGTFFE
jgi:lambda repressor-like predicted transcriptional regulator